MSANYNLGSVIAKFPSMEIEIIKLYEESDTFREICEDYALCLHAIAKIESKDPSIKYENLEDYESALEELETELRSKLEIVKSTKFK